MSQSIKRKDFLTLTISIATLSAVSAVGCGDDDDSTNGGTAGKGGGGSSGNGGNGTSGSSAGNSPQGGKNTGGNGGKNNGGSGGANGGSGGKNNGGNGGKNGHAGEGGESYGGEGGAGGEGGESYGGAGGAGGDGSVAAPKCGGAGMVETPITHNHIPNSLTTFTAQINSANPTVPFTLDTVGGHWHTITLTQEQVTKLRAGMTVEGVMSTRATTAGGVDPNGHIHTYKISCS